MHGHDQTTDCPEHAIFNAADDPDPALGDLVSGRSRDQQMDKGDKADIGSVDAEKKANGKYGFDRARDIHPGRRRLESRLDEELKCRRNRDLADDVRNEKQRADDAQDVELMEQVEFVGPRHRIPRMTFLAENYISLAARQAPSIALRPAKNGCAAITISFPWAMP